MGFNKLWKIFDVIDTGDDRRIDANEFSRGMSQLGLNLSPNEAQAEFSKIDTNGGGQVLFVEFCAYVRKRVNPDDNPAFDADIMSGEHCTSSLRKHHGHKATHTHVLTQKCMRDFDQLEASIKKIMRDKKNSWNCGRGLTSMVTTLCPLLRL